LLILNPGSKRQSGRRIVIELWWMGEKALVKERRVTRKESTTIPWASENCIAPDLSLIPPLDMYFDFANPVWADHPSKQ